MSIKEAFPPLTPLMVGETEPVRQSYAQRRLWFLNQMGTASGRHNIVLRLSLVGPALEREKLATAFNALSRRHSVLRTRYRSTVERLEQWVSPEPDVDLLLRDYTNLGGERQADAIEQLMLSEQNAAFDLLSGPVLRAILVTLADDRQELIFTVHHIAFDGRSLELFVIELCQGYAAPGTLPPVPLQYRDFAAWEPAYITPGWIEDDIAFWRGYLADVPALLEFEGRPRREGPLRAACHHFLVAPEVADRLKVAAKARGHTLFTTLVALFSLWMHYLTKKDRFFIGTDVHGRDLPILADIMGFFVNQLTIKCDLSGDPTLSEFLDRAHELTAAALAHRRLPFDVLVSALSPQREPERTPLFQVKLNYQRYRFPIDSIGEARIARTQILQDMAGFDLVLDLTHGPTGIDACLEFDLQRFTTPEIERLAPLWLALMVQSDSLLDLPVSRLCERMQQWESAHLQEQQQVHSRRNRARLLAARKPRLV